MRAKIMGKFYGLIVDAQGPKGQNWRRLLPAKDAEEVLRMYKLQLQGGNNPVVAHYQCPTVETQTVLVWPPAAKDPPDDEDQRAPTVPPVPACKCGHAPTWAIGLVSGGGWEASVGCDRQDCGMERIAIIKDDSYKVAVSKAAATWARVRGGQHDV